MSARSLNAQNAEAATWMVICGEGGARLVQIDSQDHSPAHECDHCPLCFAFGQGDLTLLAPDFFADGPAALLKSHFLAGQVKSPETPESTYSPNRGPPVLNTENNMTGPPSLPGKEPVMSLVSDSRVT